MTFEIIMIVLLSVLVFYLFCRDFGNSIDVENLEKSFETFKRETRYKLALPQIAELAKLRGFEGYWQNGKGVQFYCDKEGGHYIDLHLVDEKIKEAKAAIEIACPKKCAKKK